MSLPGHHPPTQDGPTLLLGPLLRHVDPVSATVWVETDRACEVEVLGRTARTFRVGGHHYALVLVEDLEPGSATPYDVWLDGVPVWPEPDSAFPPSRIRTPGGTASFRLAFGSCRYASPRTVGRSAGIPPDALDLYAQQVAAQPQEQWPDALVLLGDQVYADELTHETKSLLHRRRHGRQERSGAPRDQVADFEEYTRLYFESWRDPQVRWLLSTIPSSMIFDDHEMIDDWNTSAAWREKMTREPWWQGRITGGLMSYWIYQHLGNLSPQELAENKTWQAIQGLSADPRTPTGTPSRCCGRWRSAPTRTRPASGGASYGTGARPGCSWSTPAPAGCSRNRTAGCSTTRSSTGSRPRWPGRSRRASST
ncbi:DUF7800 domain-containing protein [Blastococcus sp. PRF04-17]|uniref:DUF7800 domain-containing protein n=1 Tax=Blastococcus sp. PRF04-17 TaxID=2933797 RepID=UPI001FF55DCA|nr:alkaline phosphatase D family protein [Blastococcus sp. PRF04-17]UOY01510.1 alkaline phosphatase D family protein [Blastococcus sp. PRF04-17]